MSGKLLFGVYELDRDAMELRKNGKVIPLQGQPFRVLTILAGRPGEVITREELQRQIWGDAYVDFDQSLNKAVNAGAGADNKLVIEHLGLPGDADARTEAPLAAGERCLAGTWTRLPVISGDHDPVAG